MKRNEIEPLLAILLTMGILGFPTLRLGSLKYNVPQHKLINYTITMSNLTGVLSGHLVTQPSVTSCLADDLNF